MVVEIDLDHPKRQLQMKDSKAGLAADLCPTIAGPGGPMLPTRTLNTPPQTAGCMRGAHTTLTGALITVVGQLT
jgi:hypothetical protein